MLQQMAAPHLWLPAGLPPKGGYENVIELGEYQAESWRHVQRVVLMVIDQPDPKTGQLNLMPEYFFLVVGSKASELDGDAALAHYRLRGTFEDRRNSASNPRATVAQRLRGQRLSLLAFNLASMLRIEYEAVAGSCFDLDRFQHDVLKAGVAW